MSIRFIALLACLGFLAITLGVGLFSAHQETQLGTVALTIYDEAYVGANYAYKSQYGFLRFTMDHSTKDTAVIAADDKEHLEKVMDSLDITLERAMSMHALE